MEQFQCWGGGNIHAYSESEESPDIVKCITSTPDRISLSNCGVIISYRTHGLPQSWLVFHLNGSPLAGGTATVRYNSLVRGRLRDASSVQDQYNYVDTGLARGQPLITLHSLPPSHQSAVSLGNLTGHSSLL